MKITSSLLSGIKIIWIYAGTRGVLRMDFGNQKLTRHAGRESGPAPLEIDNFATTLMALQPDPKLLEQTFRAFVEQYLKEHPLKETA